MHTIDLTARVTRLYQRHYLNMDRLAFDRWLLSRLPEHVHVLNGRCTAIQRNDAFELTVQTTHGTQCVTARALVGADGASSIVRRQFFTRQPYKYVSIQQWFAGSDPNMVHFFFPGQLGNLLANLKMISITFNVETLERQDQTAAQMASTSLSYANRSPSKPKAVLLPVQ